MKDKTSMENSLLETVISLPKFSSCIFFKALLPHNFRMLNYLAPLCPSVTTSCNCHVELWQSSLQWHNFHTKFLRTQLCCSQAKMRETDGHTWTAWKGKQAKEGKTQIQRCAVKCRQRAHLNEGWTLQDITVYLLFFLQLLRQQVVEDSLEPLS